MEKQEKCTQFWVSREFRRGEAVFKGSEVKGFFEEGDGTGFELEGKVATGD